MTAHTADRVSWIEFWARDEGNFKGNPRECRTPCQASLVTSPRAPPVREGGVWGRDYCQATVETG